jgi:Carboxypeptidase regulatory-like domain
MTHTGIALAVGATLGLATVAQRSPQPAAHTVALGVTNACPPDSVRALHAPALTVVPDSLLGENGAVAGGVFDAAGMPIVQAQVVAFPSAGPRRPKGMHTPDNGLFQIGSLPPGLYTVIAQQIGYSADSQSVTIRANTVDTLVFRLRCRPRHLEATIAPGRTTP